MDERSNAFWCYVLPPVTSLVVYLRGRARPFVRFHAWQSAYLVFTYLTGILLMEIAAALLGLVVKEVSYFFDFIELSFKGAVFVVWALGLVNSYKGKSWKAPVIGDLAMKRAICVDVSCSAPPL